MTIGRPFTDGDLIADILRRLGDLERGYQIGHTSIGSGGLRILDGGSLRIEGGQLLVLDVDGNVAVTLDADGVTVTADGAIESSDYVAGTSGWRITGGGAEFNTLTLRNGIVSGAWLADLAVTIDKLAAAVDFDGGGASSSGDDVTTTWATKASRQIDVPSWAGEAQVMNIAHAGATNSTATPAFLQVRSGIAGGSGGSNSSKRADGEWSGNVTAGNSGTVVAPGSTITVTCDAKHDGSGTWSSAANSFDLEASAIFRR